MMKFIISAFIGTTVIVHAAFAQNPPPMMQEPSPLITELQRREAMMSVGREDFNKAITALVEDWQKRGNFEKQLRELRDYAVKCGDKPGCFTEVK